MTSRRRWVYPADGSDPFEVSTEYVGSSRQVYDGLLWNDRSYQDMGDPRFASREQHKEYMRQHGLTTADDYKDQWRRDESKRVEIKQGIDPTRRREVERSIDRINSGYKPKLEDYCG